MVVPFVLLLTESGAVGIAGCRLLEREWSSGRMAPCHGVGPGSIPGSRIFPQDCPGTLAQAALAQLGERQTEDLKVPGSIPGGGIFTDRVLWCNWLALRTLNPAIRVHIPVGPPSFGTMAEWLRR